MFNVLDNPVWYGFNPHNVKVNVQLLKDGTGAYRPVNSTDFAAGGGGGGGGGLISGSVSITGQPIGVTGTVISATVPVNATAASFQQFPLNLNNGANVSHQVTGFNVYCQGVEFYADSSSGQFKIGNSVNRIRPLNYGESVTYNAPQGKQINLSSFYVSGNVSGSTLVITYLN